MSSPLPRILAGGLLVSLLATGCDARIVDLRPAASSSADTGVPPAGDMGTGPTGDMGTGPLGDMGPLSDLGTGPVEDMGAGPSIPPAGVVTQGALSGLNGYSATGDAQVYSTGSAVEVRLTNGFTSAGVPGPRVVLTTRDVLGDTGIQPAMGDIDLGPILASGDQTLSAPVEAVGAVYAWIYCGPFTVDTARAELTAP